MTIDGVEVHDTFKVGDIIAFRRLFFTHYGMYIGDGKVIHRDKHYDKATKTHSFNVAISQLEDVPGRPMLAYTEWMTDSLKKVPTQLALENAYSQIGDGKYNVLFENCEHFVTSVRFKQKVSRQVRRVRTIAISLFGIVSVVIAKNLKCVHKNKKLY